MYIVFEGIAGAGKSTQVRRLVEYLCSWNSPPEKGELEGVSSQKSEQTPPNLPFSGEGRNNRKVIHVREPGSTPIAEDIRHLAQAKHWEDEAMHPLTNAYLYAAARAQTIEMVIKPALERGDIVISDRCFLSSCVIQGEAQGLGIETVLAINNEAIKGILPDIIFYLDIDIDLALSRTFDEGGDKFEKEGREFYKKIITGYEKCEKLDVVKGKFIKIDANRGEDEVFEGVIRYIYHLITNLG